ncbi:MAG: copper chaperone PCu(A)C [Algiphilus sp.]
MASRPLSQSVGLLLFVTLLTACTASRTVSIEDGWIERPSDGAPAELHLRIRNGLAQSVRLVGASVAGSDNARLMSTQPEQRLPAIALSAGQTLRVPKDGYRILFDAAPVQWDKVDSVNLQLAVEQSDGQLLTLSYDLHVHDTDEDHHHDH